MLCPFDNRIKKSTKGLWFYGLDLSVFVFFLKIWNVVFFGLLDIWLLDRCFFSSGKVRWWREKWKENDSNFTVVQISLTISISRYSTVVYSKAYNRLSNFEF